MQLLSIKSVKPLGVQNTLDFEVDHKDHNFYAEGIVVSNSHALSYGSMSAATIYLKYKYSKEFFLTLLKLTKEESNPTEEISKIHDELKYFNLELLPPHILKSGMDFEIQGDSIRIGLGNIKGISEKTILKLLNFRREYANKFDIFRASEEAELPIHILSSLILVGSMDNSFSKTSRAKLVLEAQLYKILTKNEKTYISNYKLGEKFDFQLIEAVKYMKTALNDKGKPVIKPSRFETIKRDYQPFLKMYEFNKRNENYARYYFEKKLLGYSYSSQLIDLYKEECPDLVTTLEALTSLDREKIHIVGEVTDVIEGISKEKKNHYLKYNIKDNLGKISVMLFNDGIEEHVNANNRKAKEGDIIVVRGAKKGTAIFANAVGIQDLEIFEKISQVSEKKKVDKSV
jgi:DNA polymerase III alpha subunit